MTSRRREGFTLKSSLYLLAIACTVPVSIVAAALMYFLLNENYTRTQNELSDRASLLARAVELRIQNVIEDLQLLAVAPALREGDFNSFRSHLLEAGRVMGAFGIVLVDRQGQLIVSTRRADGEALPRRSNLETQERVFTSGKVQISDLVESTSGGAPILSVEVPVRIDGEIRYVLAAGLSPEYLADVVRARVPPTWVASIVDRKGLLISRVPDLHLIGQPIIDPLRARVGEPAGSWIKVQSRTGPDVFASFTQLKDVGWTVFVAIPRDLAEKDTRQSAILLASMVFAALITCLLLARTMSRRIVGALDAFEYNVEALRNGKEQRSLPSSLVEVNRMQKVLSSVREDLDSTEQRIESERKLLEATVASMPIGALLVDSSGHVLLINKKALELWSATEVKTVADFTRVKRLRLDGTVYPPNEWPVMRALRDGQVIDNEEVIHLSPDGKRSRLSINAAPVYDDKGQVSAAVAAFYDVSALHAALDEQKLLLDEINHRVKNTMATIQSIVLLSRSSASTVDEYVRSFQQRLVALAAAYNLLTENNWRGADVRQIVEATSAPYGSSAQIHIEGKTLQLSPKNALALTAALQELSTNAAKYGSLSVPEGRLQICWQVGSSRRLELVWTETQGPPVQPPHRRGFGSKLIQDILAHDPEWTAQIDYPPQGVIARLTLDLSE